MSTNRIRRTSMSVAIGGDETAMAISPFICTDEGQAQIADPNYSWTLHILGTPDAWRHLAKVIEDAAMELERQLAEAEVPA